MRKGYKFIGAVVISVSMLFANVGGMCESNVTIYAAESLSESEDNASEVVADSEKPVIKGKGVKNRTVYVGTKKIDYLKNVVATDNVDGTITDKIEVDDSKVNLNKAGTYKVIYSVSDRAGNTTSITKKVVVKKDAKPVIRGTKNKVVYVGTKKIDYLKGVTATDVRDGNLTSKIKVNKSKVNLNKVGIYKVTYSVTDRSKNKTTKTIKVIVKKKEYDPNNEPNEKIVLFEPKGPEGKDVNGDIPAGGKDNVGYW